MDYNKIHSTLFILSSILYLTNFLIVGQIVFDYTDFLGLIFKMSWLFWLGYFILIILIWFNFVNFEKVGIKYSYLTLSLLILYLIGTPMIFEYLPRFGDNWSHSFLAKEMFRIGRVDNSISPYEAYPGSFLFQGIILETFPSYAVMKFFPPIMHMLEIIMVFLIFGQLFNKKISFLASVFYPFFNWTAEQNHISPQFLVFFIYLVFVYSLVMILKNKNRKIYGIISILCIEAIIFSHPLTPIFIMLFLGGAFLFCEKFRSILFLFILITFVSFAAYHLYQRTTLDSYISVLRNFLEIVRFGTGFPNMFQRFMTSNQDRYMFIFSRLGITVFSIIMGLFGLFITYKKGYKLGSKFLFAWSFSMLVFIIFVGQALKGEYYEKFNLFSSVPLAALSAYIFSNVKNKSLILIILLIISPVYFMAKYGNEAFESVSLEKYKADCFYFNIYSDCVEKKEVVNSQLFYKIEDFGLRDFTVSREDIMATSIFIDKNLETSEDLIEKQFSELDRIYSNNNAWVYR